MRTTLDPTLDVVFKMLFASPASRDSLTALLSAVLNPPRAIREVQVLNPEITPDQVDDKCIVLDILVGLEDGTKLNVEMQAEKRPAFRSRALYYWSRLFGGQLERGQPYSELAPVISVLFLDYRELDGARLHSIFQILEIHDHTCFNEALQIHVVELPKRPRWGEPCEAKAGQPESALLAWSRFLGATSDEEVKEACMNHPEISRANELLEHLSATPSAQEMARQRQLAMDTYRIEIAAAKAEGINKGRVEGRVEMLIDQLNARFGALDEFATNRVRHASDEQISRWSRRLLNASTLEEVLID